MIKQFFRRTLLCAAVFIGLVPKAYAEEIIRLSSLELSKARQGWGQPHADKSVDGHTLSIGGRKFQHGFGTHAPGLLVLDLKGDAKRFRASVGVDDEVGGGRGSVEFQVLGDRKMLWQSGVMRQGEAAKDIDVSLKGVQQLVLRVTMGGDGYDYDHADWADANLEIIGVRPQTVALQSSEAVVAIDAAPAVPEIHAPDKIGVRPATAFLWTIPATGTRPLQFSAANLPPGLVLDVESGQISGSVEKEGSYAVKVRAANDEGRDESTVRIVVGDRVALTPPLGWNSYDAYGDSVTEVEVLANARALKEQLQPYGWDTVVVDYRWYDADAQNQPNNPNARAGAALAADEFGRLIPAPKRFPSSINGQGFKPLADSIHALGLKFGIHIMRGIPRQTVKANLPIEGSNFKAAEAANTNSTCGWNPDMYGVKGDTPAGQAWYDTIFRQYATWGVDFVKVDDMSAPYSAAEIEAVRRAIDKCGRSIVFSLSPGDTPLAQADHVRENANTWRVSGDFWDDWRSLNRQFDQLAAWKGQGGPGHWPDADMIPLGRLSVGNRSVGGERKTNFNKNEQVTLMSLWCLASSPLMLGMNLPDNDAWTLALLTNREVLAINQDIAKAPGARVAHQSDLEVWAKRLSDGSRAVGLFNRSDFDDEVTVKWLDLGLNGKKKVRDLWQRRELGVFEGQFAAMVPAHGAVLLRISGN